MTTGIGEMLLERGALAKARQAVLRVAAARFGTVPAGLSERIQRVSDMERLDALLDAAATAGSLQEFLPLLDQL